MIAQPETRGINVRMLPTPCTPHHHVDETATCLHLRSYNYIMAQYEPITQGHEPPKRQETMSYDDGRIRAAEAYAMEEMDEDTYRPGTNRTFSVFTQALYFNRAHRSAGLWRRRTSLGLGTASLQRLFLCTGPSSGVRRRTEQRRRV